MRSFTKLWAVLLLCVVGSTNVWADDEIELTAAMFLTWDGYGADAVSTGAATVDFNVGTELGNSAMVAGTSTVDYLTYADLTGCTKMLFEGTAGMQLRVLMNRQESNNGPLVEKNPTIGADGKAELDLTEFTYVHLNSIKTGWGSPSGTITAIKLVKPADPLAVPKENLKNVIGLAKMQSPVAKTAESYAALQQAIIDAQAALADSAATEGSLNTAKTSLDQAIAGLTLADGYVELTADMFKKYASVAEPGEGETANSAYELFTASGLPYGDGNVGELNWADLTEYSKFIVTTVGEVKPRFCLNRLVAGGNQAATMEDSKMIDINDNAGNTWSAEKYQTIDSTTYTLDIAKIVEDYTFARLHCIKKQGWGAGVTVTGMYLYKEAADTTATGLVAFDWIAGEQGYENQQDLNNVEIALDAKTTMTCTKGTGTNGPKYYTSGSAVRTYAGNTITFNGKGITKIVITGVSGKVADLTASTGELTADGIVTTWKGEADQIVLSNETKNQQHIAKLHVVYGGVEADVEPIHIANTADSAYTVAKAIELIDAGEALSDTVFVKGTVSKVESYSEKYKSISYWISDDGTTESAQFECYSGKGIGGADFASIDEVEVGAEVIVKGTMTKYGDIYEFTQNNELVTYKAPVEDSELMKQAKALAADSSAVAVGKLLAAIADAKESGDESKLQAAIDQFKADNADMEKDETAKVATNGWKKFEGNDPAGVCSTDFAPAITTYDGRTANLAESYETTVATTGQIIYQNITGLTNGSYKVGFYGNAFYTSGRGFESTMEDGADDVAYVFANDQKEFITARVATSTTENNFRQFDVQVTDGTIKLGMGKDKPGTNWHTMQIYQLTWFTTAKEAYAADQAELKTLLAQAKALLADENKTNGREVFELLIGAAELSVDSKMMNITELENFISNLKDGIAEFKKANYFIDFAEGEYYVIDAESGKMMAAGHDYGTQGIVNETGLDLTVAINTEKRMVTFDSKVANNNSTNHFLGSNLYMDSPAAEWALEYQGFGFYITNGTQYINIDANDNLVMSETPREWIIVTAEGVMEQRLGEMAAATVENPVDATFLIQGANFNRNDQRNNAWTVSQDCTNKNMSGGNETNNCAESYHSTFTISQVLKNAPKGIYKMTAQGFYRQDGETTETVPVFFIGDKTAEVPVKTGSEGNMSDASASFTNGAYTIDSIEYKFIGDELVIGIKNETAKNQWIIFDNFRLTYFGNAIDLTDIIDGYNKALADAKAALADEDNAIVTGEERTALTAAIAANENVAENQDSLTAAVTALTAATSAFTGAKASYQELADAKYDIQMVGYDYRFPYASQAKKEAAAATLTTEPTNAADAVAKTAAIYKAYRQFAESHALAEGVEGAVNMTESIKNPAAEEAIAEPWAVVLGEGSGGSLDVKSNEPWTDGDDNATHKYFDGGNWSANAWDVSLQQDIALPAGKYLMTVKSRASDGVMFTLFAGNDSTGMPALGASGCLFNRGWNDASIEFVLNSDSTLAIGVKGVAETNHQWMSFSDFRLVQLEEANKVEEPTYTYPASWDFTNWSEATVANLKADAAASKLVGWSDVEKKADAEAGNDPTEASKDNCFWYQGETDAYGQLCANGVVIEELKGLKFNNAYAAARSLAIAVNYPSTSLGEYAGAQYLWLGGGGKNVPCFVLPSVPANSEITAVVESHKTSDARGIELYAGSVDPENKIGDSFTPTIQDTYTWTIETAGDIVVYNTSGCHLYSIEVKSKTETDGITTLKNAIENGNVYNLNGQKVNKTQKGLYIINGKKVVIK